MPAFFTISVTRAALFPPPRVDRPQPAADGVVDRTGLRHWAHRRALYGLAYVWRRALVGTTFIAVGGSVGKTTTKDSIATILSTRFRTAKTGYNQNDEGIAASSAVLR